MWTWIRKENLKRETESRLIAAQNDNRKTNYREVEIGNTQQNNKSRLWETKTKWFIS